MAGIHQSSKVTRGKDNEEQKETMDTNPTRIQQQSYLTKPREALRLFFFRKNGHIKWKDGKTARIHGLRIGWNEWRGWESWIVVSERPTELHIVFGRTPPVRWYSRGNMIIEFKRVRTGWIRPPWAARRKGQTRRGEVICESWVFVDIKSSVINWTLNDGGQKSAREGKH